MKTNFHFKNYARCLAFKRGSKATRKWPFASKVVNFIKIPYSEVSIFRTLKETQIRARALEFHTAIRIRGKTVLVRHRERWDITG